MMIIGYDARLIKENRTGTSTMQEYLLNHLVKEYENCQFFIFGKIDSLRKYEQYPNVEVVNVKEKKSQLWEQVVLPFYILSKKIDIFYSAKNLTVPLLYKHKTICTILDLIPYHFPQIYFKSKLKKIYYMILLKLSSRAKAIVTISLFSVEDIKKVCSNTTYVYKIPLGVERVSIKPTNKRLNFPYFFSVGGAEPRKNIQTLITAFQKFKDKGFSHKLVIVGGEEWNGYKLDIPTSLVEDILVYNYVEDEKFQELIQYATAFIFPSMFEGFGLPVLEAMVYDRPTIVANNTSLKEIYSKYSIMVETMDPQSYVNAMVRLATEPESIDTNYTELLKRYNWSNSARALMEVIEEEFLRKGN